MGHRYWAMLACSVAAASCGASPGTGRANSAAAPQPSTFATGAPAAPAAPAAPPAPTGSASEASGRAGRSEEAHRLLISTVACWLGGVWSDAEGVSEELRGADVERRCGELVNRVYGSDDRIQNERLRAVDATEVASLKEKITAVASGDAVDASRASQLGALFDAVAAVERENLSARRAADRVKKDIEGERTSGKLSNDELDAVSPLSDSKALNALLALDAGNLTHEARALAVLAAMDRLEIARGLPKHLKIYVLERPFGTLFSVPSPEVPRDARTPLKGGVWLDYITSVAENAAHPVPPQAKSLADRELLAWGGAAAGLADKLRVETADISDTTELKRVATAVVQRLDNEYRNSQNAVRLAPEPAGPPRHLARPSH